MEKKHLDYRVVERYLSKGIVKREEYEAFLRKLTDSETEANWVHMDIHETEMEEDEDGDVESDLSRESLQGESSGTDADREAETESSYDEDSHDPVEET